MTSQLKERSRSATEDNTTVHRGSGDFLADQGVKDPDEFRVKAHLCNEIGLIVDDRSLTQEKAAEMTGQKQSDISRIINGKFDEYSVWRLLKILSALGADVVIAVNPTANECGVIQTQTIEREEAPAFSMGP